MLQAIVKFPSYNSYSVDNKVNGYIKFIQCVNMNNVLVEVNLSGLPPGIHGFHIHEHPIKQEFIEELQKGKTIKNLCNTLGGHFNPFNVNHGSYRYNTVRHAGDLINNLQVDSSGKVNIIFADSLISLNKYDVNCILNKSIVIHESPDDEGLPGLNAFMENKKLNNKEKESLKTGNAGKRIACGNITLIN